MYTNTIKKCGFNISMYIQVEISVSTYVPSVAASHRAALSKCRPAPMRKKYVFISNLNMRVYMCIYTCVCICMYVCNVYIYTCVCICMYVCMYVYRAALSKCRPAPKNER
jgi:hypothetical protein